MQSITLHSRAGADGVLRLNIPVDWSDTDLEVVVVLQPVATANSNGSVNGPVVAKSNGWPPGFFEATAGAWKGEPLQRESEGDYEVREELL